MFDDTDRSFFDRIDAGCDFSRGVLAEYWAEHGDDRWRGLQALIALGLRPHQTDYRGVEIWGYHGGTGTYRKVRGMALVFDELPAPDWCALPLPWYLLCQDDEDLATLHRLENWLVAGRGWVIAATPSACDLIAIEAFGLLSPDTQEKYLRGECD